MSKKIKAQDLPYRPCVGIMVLNSAGRVWAGRRIAVKNGELSGSKFMWQMPQGGIDKGEDPYQAALRELYEETGMKSVSLLKEASDWINYDLPEDLIGVALKGKYRGQTQRWYAFRFEGDESEIQINPPPAGEVAEFEAWDWKDMMELPELIVPFKRSVYLQVIEEFKELAGK